MIVTIIDIGNWNYRASTGKRIPVFFITYPA